MLKNIAKKIKALPPLPSSFRHIEEISKDPNVSIDKIASIIEKDPALTANLLKIANSPLYGFQREIKNIKHLVSLFGINMTKTLIANIFIKNILSSDMSPYNINAEEFNKISAMQGALAKKWYIKLDKSKVDLIFLTALLQEIGKILIANEIISSESLSSFKEEIKNAIFIEEVERNYVGITSAEIAAEIFKHWNFESNMVEIIRYSYEYQKAPANIKKLSLSLRAIKTALSINAALQEDSINRACDILEKEGMDKELFLKAIEEITETV